MTRQWTIISYQKYIGMYAYLVPERDEFTRINNALSSLARTHDFKPIRLIYKFRM